MVAAVFLQHRPARPESRGLQQDLGTGVEQGDLV
jgi:hypothetical protein